jgi:hypothetical protein
MKNGILLMIMLMLMAGMTKGQDYQWVIKNKQGVLRTTSYSTYYNLDNKPYINFNNFRHPQSGVSGARNDLFIIFDDGSFYNTYHLPTLPWNGFDGMNYYIDNNPALVPQIKYLYWTNRYEGDDLDNAQVIAQNGLVGTPLMIQGISEITGSYFNVNHDIVPKKDITVAISGLIKGCNYLLKYNDCGNIPCDGLLTASFQDISIKLMTPSSGNVNEVNLDFNSEDNAFVNFYVNEISNIDSLINSGAKMKFSIISSGQGDGCRNNSQIIEVPIRGAYDPNFIKLDSVCVQPSVSGKNDYFLNYYAQVQNTGNDVAPNVYIQIPIQEEWDVNDLHLTGLIYNGTRLDINDPNVTSEVTENNLLKVSFPKNRPLYAYNKDNRTQSIAAFEFRVKVKNSHINNLISYPDLRPQDSKSNFDGTYYDITTFVNLFSEKSAKNCFKTGGKKIEKSIPQVINNNINNNLPQANTNQKCCTCKSCCKKKCKKRRRCCF